MTNEELILKHIEEVTTGILQSVSKPDWSNDALRQSAIAKIQNIISQFGLTISQALPPALVQEYFGSIDNATAAMIAAGEKVSPTLALTPAGLIAKPFQKVIHLKAVEKLVDDAMLDIGNAVAMAAASTNTTVNETVAAVKGEMIKGQIRGDTRKYIQSRVMDKFRERGLTSFQVEDKNGRIVNLPLDFYSMTVVRSKMRDAAVQGSAARYRELGQDLVIITGNPDQCEHCAHYRDMVVSLDGKTEGFPVVGQGGILLPPYHPNCRCGIRPVIRPTPAELAAHKKRNAQFGLPGDRRTPAQKAAYDREQAGRRKARAEMKQFMRMQENLGSQAPATLGAFRNMKRKDTATFKDLQSLNRSVAATRGAETRKLNQAAAAAGPVATTPAGIIAAAVTVADLTARAALITAALDETGVAAQAAVPVNPADYKLPDPEKMREIGEQNYKSLNDDDDYIYNRYVGSAKSFEYNKFLYSGDFEKYKAGELPQDKRTDARVENIEALSDMLKKYTLPQKMRTVRNVGSDFMESVLESVGVKMPDYVAGYNDKEHIDEVRKILTGVRYTNKGFTSASYNPEANVFNDHPVQMVLLSDEGQKGMVTGNTFESEILFDRDTEFEFVGFDIGKNIETQRPILEMTVRVVK